MNDLDQRTRDLMAAEAKLAYWVVVSATEGWWNNELGWVPIPDDATRFKVPTGRFVPISAADDAKWKLVLP